MRTLFTTKRFLILLFCVTILTCLSGCKKQPGQSDPWKNAIYTEDTEFGTGASTCKTEVKVGEHNVIFTIHTDADTVGEALMENKLIDGEEGPYGLYIKVVNGITADYDIDQSYWAFYINGEYASTGVDSTPLTEGEEYQLVYSR